MTRTRPLPLVVLAMLGAVSGWLLETGLAASGRAIVIPPVTLAIALLLIGVIVVLMALPVRKVARRISGARIDPFYATRVVMLAKASALGGALLAGAALGIVVFLLGRPVPGVGSITLAFAGVVGAALLLAGGLVAEYMCAIPPDDEKRPDGRPDPQGVS